MTRIVYSGAVVSNGGDAAIMAAQIDALDMAYPGHLPVLHDSSPAVARRLFPGCEALPTTAQVAGVLWGGGRRQVVLRPLNRARLLVAAVMWRWGASSLATCLLRGRERPQLMSLAEADVVAYTGGTSLIEKYDVGAKLFELQLARALGRPVVLLPQSLGPFAQRRNRALVRAVVQHAAVVLLRDERSKDHLAHLRALMRRVVVIPDIVFALVTVEASASLAQGELPERVPRIVVSVRDCTVFFSGDEDQKAKAQKAYEQAITALVTHLVRGRGAVVTFLSTCQGVPEYWTDDSLVAARIAQALPADVSKNVDVDRQHRSTEDLRRTYGGFDLVVATRLHAAILALAGGAPVMPIAYEFKTHEVMGQLGLGGYVTDVQDADAESLVAVFERLAHDLPDLRPAVAARVSAMAAEARSTGHRVLAAVSQQ